MVAARKKVPKNVLGTKIALYIMGSDILRELPVPEKKQTPKVSQEKPKIEKPAPPKRRRGYVKMKG